MDQLVQRLSCGEHPITVGGPNPSLQELQHRIQEIGYVFIKFTDTRGGTDLGVRIDKGAIRMEQADFERGQGIVHIEGMLTLNFTKVRCIATIDLATLQGVGHLVVQEEAESGDPRIS